MKTSRFLWIMIFFAVSCKEAERGQTPVDNQAPGMVTDVQVENVAGGAIISYAIPTDEDLLYVKAVYTLDNEQIMEQKASAYASSLRIEGFGKSREVSVTLIAGDRSKNESEPVVVQVQPKDAPIYKILESVKSYDDFGGIRLDWENPEEADVVLSVVTPNEVGEFIVAENFYTNAKIGKGNIRGFEAQERIFGMCIRDRWNNLTDTIYSSHIPLFEEEIDGSMSRWNPPGIPYTQYASYAIENLWDGNPATFYLQQTKAFPHSFTFDLGQLAKLSRIKQWQRQGASLIYSSQNVNKFELWGSVTPDVSNDFSGWIKIGEFEVVKPSGRPTGETPTPEDAAAAAAGHDFNIDPAAPAIRYIRYVVKGTFSGDANVSIGELKFFGSIN